jgi:hypothetical protein
MKQMNKILAFLASILLIQAGAFGQYYYKDLISHGQMARDVAELKQQKVRKVNIRSFEADGSVSEGFFCKRNISRDYTRIETGTRTSGTAPSLAVSIFSADGTPLSNYDSSEFSVTSISYAYDGKNQLSAIRSEISSRDDDYVTVLREDHLYQYSSAGRPEKMLRILNNNDTSLILFGTDEKNNVNLEKNTKTGSVYYYYYDENNRLTDIVRESPIHGRMMPDYLFAYDDQGRLGKMMSTEEGSSQYLIWLYKYNAQGMRIKEEAYSKEKELLGTLEYSYQ